jgi:hypothetical protein
VKCLQAIIFLAKLFQFSFKILPLIFTLAYPALVGKALVASLIAKLFEGIFKILLFMLQPCLVVPNLFILSLDFFLFLKNSRFLCLFVFDVVLKISNQLRWILLEAIYTLSYD